MKKLILIAFFFIAGKGTAQFIIDAEKKVAFFEKDYKVNLSAKKISTKINQWVTAGFGDSQMTVKTNTNKKIIVKGITQILYTTSMPEKMILNEVTYTMDISIKKNGYKIVIDDYIIKTKMANTPLNAHIVTSKEEYRKSLIAQTYKTYPEGEDRNRVLNYLTKNPGFDNLYKNQELISYQVFSQVIQHSKDITKSLYHYIDPTQKPDKVVSKKMLQKQG